MTLTELLGSSMSQGAVDTARVTVVVGDESLEIGDVYVSGNGVVVLITEIPEY